MMLLLVVLRKFVVNKVIYFWLNSCGLDVGVLLCVFLRVEGELVGIWWEMVELDVVDLFVFVLCIVDCVFILLFLLV